MKELQNLKMILNSLGLSSQFEFEKLQNLEKSLKYILKNDKIFRLKINKFVKKVHLDKIFKLINSDIKKIRKISIQCLIMILSFESLVNKLLLHKKLSFIKSLIILNNDYLRKNSLEEFYFYFLKKKKEINSFLQKQLTTNKLVIWYFLQNELIIKKIDKNFNNIFEDEIFDPRIHPFGIFVINKKIKKTIIDFHSKKENVYNRNTVNNFYFFKNKTKNLKSKNSTNITNLLDLKNNKKKKLFSKNPSFLKKNLKRINQIFFTKFTNNFFKGRESSQKKNFQNSFKSKRNSLNNNKCKRTKSSPHKTIENFLNQNLNKKKQHILFNKIKMKKNFNFKNKKKKNKKKYKSVNISMLSNDRNLYLKKINKKIFDFKKFKLY